MKNINEHPESFDAGVRFIGHLIETGQRQEAQRYYYALVQLSATAQEKIIIGKLARKVGLFNEAEIQFLAVVNIQTASSADHSNQHVPARSCVE